MGNIIKSEVIVDTTVLSKSDVATYAVVTKPFSTSSTKGEVPAGTSLQELADQLTPHRLQRFLNLYLGGERIHRHLWPRIRLKTGAHVTGRIIPQGGGGSKNPLRWVLQLVIAVAAIVTTALTWGALGPVWASLLGAAISFGGSMLVNMIAPVKPAKLPELSGDGVASPTYSISGSKNQLNPFGVIPRVLGKHRMTPPLGARPFTEIVGDDQYLWQIFIWGYGPLAITDIKIGETAFETLQDAQIETISGAPGEVHTTLPFPDVFEDSFQVVLENNTGRNQGSLGVDELWVTKTSQLGPKSLSVDVWFSNGLAHINQFTGVAEPRPVTLQIRYRKVGDVAWTYRPDWFIQDATTQPFRLGKQWDVTYDATFQYEVQMRNVQISLDDEDFPRELDNVYWTTLRSIMPGNPVLMEGLCSTVVRIRATKQLNGVINQLNGIASSIFPVFEGGNWNTLAETNNPGALARAVWQGAGNARPVADSKLHLTDIEAFYTDCKDNDYAFNMVRDFQASVWETLQDVCAAGRASPGHRDGKWTVVMDRPQDTPVQMFTPRNSSNFRGSIPYSDTPHGLRIRFVNELKNYEQDERIVYADGYNENNAEIFEGVEFPGITHPDLIWKFGRFHYAQALLRGESYSFNTDIEHMVCTRGDLIAVAHDVPAWSYSWGRVKALVTSGADTVGVIVDDNVAIGIGTDHALRFRLKDGTMLRRDIDSTNSGEFKTVAFLEPIATASGPQVGDLWSSGVIGEETRDLLVIGIKPGRDMSATLMCVDYSPAVYEADQGEIPPFESGITNPLGIGYPVIASIRSDEGVMVRNSDNTLSVRVLLHFQFLSNRLTEASGIEIQSRIVDGSDWVTRTVESSFKANVSLENHAEGVTYDFRARYQFSLTNFGDWSPEVRHTVIGKSTKPPAPTSLRLEGPTTNRQLRWLLTERPIDVVGFFVVMNEGNDTNFDTGLPLHTGMWSDSPFPLGNQGVGVKTFLVKTVDAAGLLSETAAAVTINLGDPIAGDNVDTYDFKVNSFPGTVTDGELFGGNLVASEILDTFWTGEDTDFYWSGADADLYWVASDYLSMMWEFSYQPAAEWVGIQDVQIYTEISGTNLNATIEWSRSTTLYWTSFAEEDTVALGGDGFEDNELFWSNDTHTATSTTSIAIGTGAKVFTVQAGKAFAAAQVVIASSIGSPSNEMTGTVTSYSGTTLTLNITASSGAGSFTDWVISSPDDDSSLMSWAENSEDAIWLPWLGLTNDVTDDLYLFRLITPASQQQAVISTAKVHMRAPVVEEDVEDLAIATPAGTRVPLTKSYNVIRGARADIQEDGAGARSIIVVDKDPDLGPLLKAYNAANTQVTATVDVHIRGN